MTERLVVTVSTVNDDGEVLSSKEISNKAVLEPTDFTNFGYGLEEQITLMHDVQQELLEKQANFLKSAQ